MWLLLLACFTPSAPPETPPAPVVVAPPAETPPPPPPAEIAPPAAPAETPPPPVAATPVETAPSPPSPSPKTPSEAAATPADKAAAPAEDPAAQARLDAAKKAVETIYFAYTSSDNPPDVDRYFSASLKKMANAAEKYEQAHDTLLYDFDPVIDGQDWELSGLSYVATAEGEKVKVVASFKNSGKSTKITYYMVQEGDAWKVDDIRGSKWSLRKLLKIPG